jgi:hypothetical protein
MGTKLTCHTSQSNGFMDESASTVSGYLDCLDRLTTGRLSHLSQRTQRKETLMVSFLVHHVLAACSTYAFIEFCCQHPRWTQRSRHDKSVHTSPCSVYLHHNLSSELSTYFIAASPGEDWISSLKEVLKPADSTPSEQQTIFKSVAGSPFSLHAVMSGVAFVHSQEYVKVVRDRLMNQIRKVNDYSEQPAKRSGNLQSLQGNVEERVMLENVTKDLHLVSQTADTGIANADMAIKIHEEMLDAFKQLQAHVNLQSHRNTVNSTEDALRYTLKSMQCQRNWLVSYKARKDTAMNFVSIRG